MRAKLFLTEDNRLLTNALKVSLKMAGYDDLIIASTLQEALDKVQEVKKAGVKIAILDGSLGKRLGGADGEEIAKALRDQIKDINIISHSLDPMPWADRIVLKGDFEELLAAIKEFSPPKKT